jgi:uncharacterized protein with HEPN domain
MPSRSPQAALADIQRNIERAFEFVSGMTFEAFQADRRTVYAVIRCLEIISEASRRLPDDLKARHSKIPWADVAGAGNVLRHDYEDVLDEIVWRTVEHSLGLLANAVRIELERLNTP